MSELTSVSAEDLLIGAQVTYPIEVPNVVLRPGQDEASNGQNVQTIVTLKPLTIGSFQLITKAAREDPGLMPLLMIKEAMVEPQLSLGQVRQMHLGLVDFLMAHVRRISGMDQKKNS